MFALIYVSFAAQPLRGGFALLAVPWQDVAMLLAGLLLLVVAWRIVRRRRAVDEDHPYDPHIPLIALPPPLPPGHARPVRPSPEPAEPRGTQESAGTQGSAATQGSATQRIAEPVAEAWGEEVQAGPVRFHRPPEGTLQLLPGRLEIVSGKEAVDEIRFVKVPGKDPIVTFGRSRGEPHTHIELQSPTVSRRHAAMRFHKGIWHIANLSQTNPVVVRGKQLKLDGPPVRLEDGDEVEMGEVTFRFHAR